MGTILGFAETTSSSADAGLAIGFLVVFGLIGLLVLAWYIWVLLDILKYPDEAWVRSGQNKQLWIILWIIGFCLGGSIIIGLIYLYVIRPKVKLAGGVA